MDININNYNFSPTSHVGNKLKQPLFHLVANVALAASPKPHQHIACVVAKLALHCIVGLVLVVPAGIAWFAGKIIVWFSKTQINHENLSLAPPPFEIPEETEEESQIDVRVLAKRFDAFNDGSIPEYSKKKSALETICNSVANNDVGEFADNPEKNQLFCKEMKTFLRKIIHQININKVSREMEKEFLVMLAEADNVCAPTWLEAAARIYSQLSGKNLSVVMKLIGLVQEYKELLILEFAQVDAGGEWHVVNYMRNLLGDELGLNMHLNQFDRYAEKKDPVFGKTLCKWIFMQRYEDANRMVEGITNMINSRAYDPTFQDFIVEIIKKQKVEDPEGFVGENFFNNDYEENDYRIKECGVNLMLKEIQILC